MNANETEFVSLSEAARLLGVSKPTVSRWIRAGYLSARRVGPRSLRIRRSDLGRMERAAGPRIDALGPVYVQGEGFDALEAMRNAERLRAEMLAERGGRPFPSSLPLIHEDRDERVRQL